MKAFSFTSLTHSKILGRWLWDMSQGLRGKALCNAMIGILMVALDFAFILASKYTIDIATGCRQGNLIGGATMLICVALGRISLAFVRRWVSSMLGVKAQNKLQTRIFSHLMHSTWSGLERHHSGDVLNRLEMDVSDVKQVITDTLPDMITVLVRLTIAFVLIATYDIRLAFVMVCIAPVFILLSKVYIRRMRAINREVRATDSRIQSLLQESVLHRMVLKALEQEELIIGKLSSEQAYLTKQVHERTHFASLSGLLINVGFSTGYLVTFLWGAHSLQQGLITYGTMLAFVQLVGQIQGPFREMTRFIPLFISSITASERLMELEDSPLEEKGKPVYFTQGAGIRIENVTYAYQKGKRSVIQNLSYDFPIGSTTAILGETGAGKTTLIRLILALLKPDEGNVRIYDENHSVQASSLTRCNLVYVPQGNSLFSGTVRENLLMGNAKATEQEMADALRTACADFVFQLPLGLDARCGEQGAGLSEGQSQRIAIARALLRKGSILLLDEATSALDPATEKTLLHNLSLHDPGFPLTILCITHRPAVMEYCTQTLQLERHVF